MRLNLLYDNNETKTTTTTTTTLQSMWRFFIDGQTHRTQQKSLAKKGCLGCNSRLLAWHRCGSTTQDARRKMCDAGRRLRPLPYYSQLVVIVKATLALPPALAASLPLALLRSLRRLALVSLALLLLVASLPTIPRTAAAPTGVASRLVLPAVIPVCLAPRALASLALLLSLRLAWCLVPRALASLALLHSLRLALASLALLRSLPVAPLCHKGLVLLRSLRVALAFPVALLQLGPRLPWLTLPTQ